MDLREITTTNFVLLQDSWTSANCLELLKRLQPSHAIISKGQISEVYYLFEASYLSRLLTNTPQVVSLAEVLDRTTYIPVPALESDSEAEDAPEQCIVLEDGYPIGFCDASIPPDAGTLRGTKGIHAGIDASEFTLPALAVDVPEKVPLNGVVSVLVLLSSETLSEAKNVLPLNLPPGTVVDIIMWAGKGLAFEGDAEGQLVIPEDGETLPLRFRLRGLEAGPRKFRVFAFHDRKPLGVLPLSVQVLNDATETSNVSQQGETYPLQPLSVDYPGLSLITLDRHLRGKTELTPQLNAQSRLQEGSDPLAEDTTATSPKVLWQDCRPELLISNLQLDQRYGKTDAPLNDLLANELCDLLARLFSGTDSILVETLTPGFSGAKVLKVQPFITEQGAGRPFIVKFGDVRAIEQEYTNYKQYIHFFIKDGRNTSADKHEQTVHLGGILYSFVGADTRRTQDFGMIYPQRDFPQVKTILDNLFRGTFENWYASPTPLQPLNLTEAYQWQDGDRLDSFGRIAEEHLPTVRFQETLFFTSFKKLPARSFPNPFLVLSPARPFIRATYVSTTHGDLNQHNILIDQMDYSWLIDFQSTGRSHILRDVATLDAVMRFQLLSAHQATLDEFLAMEEALCVARSFSQLESLQNSFETDNPVLAKTYQTVLHLRRLAHWIVEKNPADDMSEYYIALLYIALDTLQYFSLSIEQRERALLSASLLVDMLGLVTG